MPHVANSHRKLVHTEGWDAQRVYSNASCFSGFDKSLDCDKFPALEHASTAARASEAANVLQLVPLSAENAVHIPMAAASTSTLCVLSSKQAPSCPLLDRNLPSTGVSLGKIVSPGIYLIIGAVGEGVGIDVGCSVGIACVGIDVGWGVGGANGGSLNFALFGDVMNQAILETQCCESYLVVAPQSKISLLASGVKSAAASLSPRKRLSAATIALE
jgi:hypothetical protein